VIYAFGNSHSHFFTDSHPGELRWGRKRTENFASYSGNFHNPAYRHVLAHKFGERFLPFFIEPISSLSLTAENNIMFVVGEIDCRWHFPKKVETQNRSIDDVLIECIDKYFFPSFLQLKSTGHNVVGWGGHPSTTKGHNDDPDNPIYGDCLLRNEISLRWNDLLKERCDANDIKFVSIIRDLIDENGLSKMEYFYDDYHLNPLVMPFVIEKCKTEGLINA
jgi:hypothetical protein